jgi:hypothetical protein
MVRSLIGEDLLHDTVSFSGVVEGTLPGVNLKLRPSPARC